MDFHVRRLGAESSDEVQDEAHKNTPTQDSGTRVTFVDLGTSHPFGVCSDCVNDACDLSSGGVDHLNHVVCLVVLALLQHQQPSILLLSGNNIVRDCSFVVVGPKTRSGDCGSEESVGSLGSVPNTQTVLGKSESAVSVIMRKSPTSAESRVTVLFLAVNHAIFMAL